MSKIEKIKEMLYKLKEEIGDDIQKIPMLPSSDVITNEQVIQLYSMVQITFGDEVATYKPKLLNLLSFYAVDIDKELVNKYINKIVVLILKIKKV